jgi:Zn-dependent M28 family amino/carboxypeptidase
MSILLLVLAAPAGNLLAANPGTAHSDAATLDLVAAGKPIAPQPVDPAIAAAIKDISPERMRHIVESLVGFGNRSTISSMDKDLPAGKGVTAAAAWLADQYREIGRQCNDCLEVETDTFVEPPQTGAHPRIVRPTTITNVYAILKGSDPAQAKRMYLVTGHYDSRVTDVMNTHAEAPGANDDASGVAVSLECARVLSRRRFPATIVFATVAGEEQGLNGSAHLAKLAKSEGWELAGVLNDDIVGGDTTPGDKFEDKSLVRVFSENIPATVTPEQARRLLMLGLESDSPSRELARAIVDIDHTYFSLKTLVPVLEMRLDRYLRGGDHSSFNQQGFTAVRFTEWRENFNHQHQDLRTENGVQYGDLIQFDDFSYMANVARLNAATLATLASAPGVPQQVAVDTTALDNNSGILWKAPDGATQGTRYEVLWRETRASDWEYSAPAEKYADPALAPKAPQGPDAIRVNIPVSKDNVIFGIRACDTAGHCSPAVAPVPLPRP